MGRGKHTGPRAATFKVKRKSAKAYGGLKLTNSEKIASVVISSAAMCEGTGPGYGGGGGGSRHGNTMSRVMADDKFKNRHFTGIFTNLIDSEVFPGVKQARISAATAAGFDRPTNLLSCLFRDYHTFKKAFNLLPATAAHLLKLEFDFSLRSLPKSRFAKELFVRKKKARKSFQRFVDAARKDAAADEDFMLDNAASSSSDDSDDSDDGSSDGGVVLKKSRRSKKGVVRVSQKRRRPKKANEVPSDSEDDASSSGEESSEESGEEVSVASKSAESSKKGRSSNKGTGRVSQKRRRSKEVDEVPSDSEDDASSSREESSEESGEEVSVASKSAESSKKGCSSNKGTGRVSQKSSHYLSSSEDDTSTSDESDGTESDEESGNETDSDEKEGSDSDSQSSTFGSSDSDADLNGSAGGGGKTDKYRKLRGANKKAKLGSLLKSNRRHPKNVRECEILALECSKGARGPGLSKSKCLDQVSDALLVISKNSGLKGLTEALPKLKEAFRRNGQNNPQCLGDFVGAVADGAPEGSKEQADLKMLSTMTGASGKTAMQSVLGSEVAAAYVGELTTAEELGGYGDDGGPGGGASIPRQAAGAHATLRMAAAVVAAQRPLASALKEQLRKMPDLDTTTLDKLSEVVEPPVVLGGEARADEDGEATDETHIDLSLIYCWASGQVFIFENDLYKVQ